MNIFINETDILGKIWGDGSHNSLYEFLDQAHNIREHLGEHAYLLDKYLSYLLEAANHRLAYNAAADGFEYGSRLYQLCAGVLRGEPLESDLFFHQANTYTKTHPLNIIERSTQIAIYCTALAEPFIKISSKNYFQELSVEINAILDVLDMGNLYEKISALLGDSERTDKLNLLFRHKFLIAPTMSIFLQGITNQLLDSLTLRDSQTSRQIFQLLITAPELISDDNG